MLRSIVLVAVACLLLAAAIGPVQEVLGRGVVYITSCPAGVLSDLTIITNPILRQEYPAVVFRGVQDCHIRLRNLRLNVQQNITFERLDNCSISVEDAILTSPLAVIDSDVNSVTVKNVSLSLRDAEAVTTIHPVKGPISVMKPYFFDGPTALLLFNSTRGASRPWRRRRRAQLW